MDLACSTYGGYEKCIQIPNLKNLKERDHLGDIGTDERLILKWISNN
jgi:hypothetical protein